MKVMLVTSEQVPNYFPHFLTRFRQQIGTCDHIYLSRVDTDSNERILNRHRAMQRYDRSIFLYGKADTLHNELRLFHDFDELTLMCIESETKEHFNAVTQFFEKHPWIRWLGNDKKAWRAYCKHGLDAYLLPKVIHRLRPSSFNISRRVECFVLGFPFDPTGVQGKVEVNFIPRKTNSTALIEKRVRCGDLVLITDKHYLDENLVDLAMSQGAIVVIAAEESGLAMDNELMRRKCLIIDNLNELDDIVDYILEPSMHETLIHDSWQDSQQFSPEKLADETARLISLQGRKRELYLPLTKFKRIFR